MRETLKKRIERRKPGEEREGERRRRERREAAGEERERRVREGRGEEELPRCRCGGEHGGNIIMPVTCETTWRDKTHFISGRRQQLARDCGGVCR